MEIEKINYKDSFKTECYRGLSKFIGEITASSAATIVSLMHTNHYLDHSINDSWASLSKEYGIILDGMSSDRAIKSANRLNLVNMYSGLDSYLRNYRKEFQKLKDKDWESRKEYTLIQELSKNIDLPELLKNNNELISFLNVIEYYRILRNSIVHPDPNIIEDCKLYYTNNLSSIEYVRRYYNMRSAPNTANEIDFHDVKILSRIFLDILPLFEKELDPGDMLLAKQLPLNHKWRNTSYPIWRRDNAIIKYLERNYNISDSRSRNIIVIYGSLA